MSEKMANKKSKISENAANLKSKKTKIDKNSQQNAVNLIFDLGVVNFLGMGFWFGAAKFVINFLGLNFGLNLRKFGLVNFLFVVLFWILA